MFASASPHASSHDSHIYFGFFITDEYEHVNQYAHGVKREAQGSSFLAYFNIVCVVCGMGALQLPFALKQGGWIGLLILCLSWFFSTCELYIFPILELLIADSCAILEIFQIQVSF